MNYAFFHYGQPDKPETAYRGADEYLGYPALKTILSMKPDFFIGTGDNVYYDHPVETRARTQAELRRKWHEQFIQERYKKLFAVVPAYWEKDDHDYRYNDSDPYGDEEPSHELGIKTFIEQVPVVDPQESSPRTYRTHRIGKLLQVWLPEGRDYRSPNSMPDGPEKSIWGTEQKAWLRKTLLASDAVFKILVSPTPMVGPDDAYKSDNHVNQNGFRHEGEEFFRWLKNNGFLRKNFYIVCGDRHWQYHSVHPSGFEEFSCGALCDANSRLGREPGDPESTDPHALVTQPYIQKEPSGGFLCVTVFPRIPEKTIEAVFAFYDEFGTLLYSVKKIAQ
jgi:alkaline phosphatase/alkaline phosphatase D